MNNINILEILRMTVKDFWTRKSDKQYIIPIYNQKHASIDIVYIWLIYKITNDTYLKAQTSHARRCHVWSPRLLRKCLNRNRNDLEILAKKLLQMHVCSRRSLINGTSSREATVLVYYSDDLVFQTEWRIQVIWRNCYS